NCAHTNYFVWRYLALIKPRKSRGFLFVKMMMR
ncbi:uncharacterized protein METZ01_LOCUS97766, partial [marine metagenome]